MKKSAFIDNVRVNDPCSQAWDEMIGNDKVRFCSHCAKDVNNLSAMNRKEALRLVRKSGGSLCIRYVQHPDSKAPVFADQLTQITRRRAPLMAAGVVSATLSLATLTYAQGGAETLPMPAAAKVSACEDIAPATKAAREMTKEARVKTDVGSTREQIAKSYGVLEGIAVDANEARIPNLGIELLDETTATVKSVRTGPEGEFRFKDLKLGTYTLRTEASSGFASSVFENIVVDSNEARSVTIAVQIAVQTVVVGGAMVSAEFEGPLAMAVSLNDLQESQNLIARGENVNRKEEDGTTPLFLAVENGDITMVQLLLDSGAKVNARNDARLTPIMRIDEDASVELIQLLLRYGAKVNRVSEGGVTALAQAARFATPEVVKALIDAGAKLDVQNALGRTALMEAADADNIESARMLIVAGANVNLKDNDGDTAWDLTSNSELEELLETYGAVIDDDGPTEP